jgi:hypothetical protein
LETKITVGLRQAPDWTSPRTDVSGDVGLSLDHPKEVPNDSEIEMRAAEIDILIAAGSRANRSAEKRSTSSLDKPQMETTRFDDDNASENRRTI